jgi:hypothetical protein
MHRTILKDNRVFPRRLLTSLVVAITPLAMIAESGLAAQRHSYSYSFGEPGSGAGQVSLSPTVLNFTSHGSSGVAVNDVTHDVYVADTKNNRVDQFTAAGLFVRAWGWGVADGREEFETCTLVCQAGTASVDHNPPYEYKPGEILKPTFIALDNTGGPSQGDMYIVESELGLVEKFTASGEPLGPQNNGAATPGGEFGEIAGIAVSRSGDLVIADNHYPNRIVVLTESGSFKEEFAFPTKTTREVESVAQRGIALDDSSGPSSGDIYTLSGSHQGALKYSFAGLFLSEPDFEPGTGLTVDSSNGDLYVGHAGDIAVYDASGNPLGRFGSAEAAGGEVREPAGLAVDSLNHTVFLADAGSQRIDAFVPVTMPGLTVAPAGNLELESTTLSGTINPGGTTPDAEIKECRFEYVEDTVLQAHKATQSTNEIFAAYGSSSACLNPDGSTTAPLAPDTAEHPVHANLAGLHPGATYDYRLLARNVNLAEATSVETFTTVFPFLAPSIEAVSASAVNSTSAVLNAEVNPNHYATSYHFEYIDNTTYEADLATGDGFQHAGRIPAGADAILGATGTPQSARQLVAGLAPATTYRYRLVADNGHGETSSLVQGFVTQSAIPSPLLLDGRAWEMVSPPEKSGSTIEGISEKDVGGGGPQAAADGSGLAYTANRSFGQEAPSNRSFTPSQFLAFRGANGWTTKDVTTPREDVVGVIPGNTEGYRVFSGDLSLGMVQPRGHTPLSPSGTETTPYLRAANGEFLPLLDPADVLPGAVFDGPPEYLSGQGGLSENEPEAVGGSSDLHSVVIASCYKLTEDAVQVCDKGGGRQNLYVWNEATLQLMSVLPGNVPATALSELGGPRTGAAPGGVKRHAVSEDGTRLVFTTDQDGIYLRDLTLGETVRLDQPEPGAAGGTSVPLFQDMSADGSKVFFTDTARLTADSEAGPGRPDLYMCEILVEGEELACALKDLSVARNVGEAGAVLGASIGADAGGHYVYFVANGALTPDAEPGDCIVSPPFSSTCGLYLYDTVAGTVKLVTTLSGADYHDWADGTKLNPLTARVSPNGRFLAFMSQRNLTGYDNRDAVSGQPDQEVYLYDRLGDGGEGKLVCASCNPTGARPHGVAVAEALGGLGRRLNEENIWPPGTWIGAAIPGWTPTTLMETLYQSRYLSDSGRLFFNSADALVPRDSNGTADVYEYESPQGEGQPASNSCTVSSPTYSSMSGGCVDLVSSGTSPEESVFLDASESGDDVFFLTASQVASTDLDTTGDIYDARVGGIVSEAARPPACEGDACQSPVSAPEDPTPGSLTFQGPGNPPAQASGSVRGKSKPSVRARKLVRALKLCARKPKSERRGCVRRARRAYGPVGNAKQSNKGAPR